MGLALLAGFAMLSSGLVVGASSPALAEAPVVGDEPAAVTAEPADQPVAQGYACGDGSWIDFPQPVVTGRIRVGETLSASHVPVVPAADDVRYQWYSTDVKANADMVPIKGATGLTYKQTAADVDKWLTFQIQIWRNGNCDIKYGLSVGPVRTDAAFAAPATSPFSDVAAKDKFYTPISWMEKVDLSTGNKAGDYMPKSGVTREAMAAFIFRFQGSTLYQGPAESPFADVKPGDKFYNEIAWMYETGLSTGVKQKYGKPKYAPKDRVSREAMAAFIYRLEAGKAGTPATSPFTDVKTRDKFFKEISWMSSSGLSTGIKQSNGSRIYAPKSTVSREAMAAFLYRLESN